MGKKSKSKNPENLPFVSVCTPTFNRRPFIPSMIKCFNHQTYPKDKIEWIIIDDGTDKIEDLVCDISNVKYFKYDEKMPLGKKRNIMHEKSQGEILVYMDDDDYYPPERIMHAVNMLQSHPKALCAGASEIYIYFKHKNQMVQFGPYGPNHATAGTFAFKRELLKEHRYNDTAALAEEKAFLKDYTVPFVQLEPKKTILVFSHDHNTFDKKKLLDTPHPQYVKVSDKKVEDFIKEQELFDFFMKDIENALKEYEPGKPSMKPDVLKQIEELTEEREKLMKEKREEIETHNSVVLNEMGLSQQQIENLKQNPMELNRLINENQIKINQNQVLLQLLTENNNQKQSQIMCEVNGKSQPLSDEQIVDILKKQDSTIQKLKEDCIKKDKYIQLLEAKINMNFD